MNYEDYPIIKVKEAVEQEDWFKLSNGKFDVLTSKSDFQRNGWAPNSGKLSADYLDVTCKIEVRLENGKIKTRMYSPHYCRFRASSTSVPQRAVEKIRDLMIEAIPKIEERKEEERIEEEKHQSMLAKRVEVAEKFGSKLTGTTYEVMTRSFDYAMSKHFGFRFSMKEDCDDDFYDIRINGTFTMEQLKKLKDFIAECPQAAADRILHGKK